MNVNVYNGARFLEDMEKPADFDGLISEARRSRPEFTVFVHLEQDADVLSSYSDSGLDRVGKAIGRIALSGACKFRSQFEAIRNDLDSSLARDSAFRHEREKCFKTTRFFPNIYKGDLGIYPTHNGGRILFQRAELERAATTLSDSLISERVDFIAFWHAHMLARGTKMLVLLLPDKVSVYGSEIGIRTHSPQYLNRLANELSSRGIPVLNGLSVLQPYAQADLNSGELSFWRDDLHWNPLGVERIAHATAQMLRNEVSGFPEDEATIRRK